MPSNLQHIFHTVVDQILFHCPDHRCSRNLSNAQFTELLNLSDNESFVIKKADKGSNIVIKNKTDYIAEGLRQLSNNKFYKKNERQSDQ